MKVLRIHQSDNVGGAGIAAYRLHTGLLAQGIDSHFLVHQSKSGSDRVSLMPPPTRWNYQLQRVTKTLGFNDIHCLNTLQILQHPAYQAADILHLHNLHGGYFNYLTLPLLTKHKPAILTLHDMWAFTGHCAYSFECDRWQSGCGRCPHLETYPAVKRDSTHWEWKLKRWIYQHSNLKAVVTTSRWMAEQAKQSILGHLPIHHIPPGLDTDLYQPLDPLACRLLLGLAPSKRVLMACADSLTNPRKGGTLLIQALQTLPDNYKQELTLLVLGEGASLVGDRTGIQTHELGFVSGDRLKAIAYSAADLFLFPTLAENFGLVAQEAIACGTPVVAFKVGGVPDIVRPGVTGYLAEAQNVQDFQQGLLQLLADPSERDRLRQSCRQIALQDYPLNQYATRYITLYKSCLDAQTNLSPIGTLV